MERWLKKQLHSVEKTRCEMKPMSADVENPIIETRMGPGERIQSLKGRHAALVSTIATIAAMISDLERADWS